MTIQEAIKSGKPFTRPKYYKNEEQFCIKSNLLCLMWLNHFVTPSMWVITIPEYTGFEVLDMEDILADDWEILNKEEIWQ